MNPKYNIYIEKNLNKQMMKAKSYSLKVLKYSTDSPTNDSSSPNSLALADKYNQEFTKASKKNLVPVSFRSDSSDREPTSSPQAKALHISLGSSDSSADSSDCSSDESPSLRSGQKGARLSIFSNRRIIDAGKMSSKAQEAEGASTPKPSRRKQNLYKYSIMKNSGVKEPVSPAKTSSTNFETDDAQKTKVPSPPNVESKVSTPKSSFAIKPSTFARESKETETFNIENFIFGSKVDEKVMNHHCELIRKGLHYSTKLLKAPPASFIEQRKITLKELKTKDQKTLLLDLDETLITSCSAKDIPDKILRPDCENGDAQPICIKIRPGAKEFLKKMKEHFEIILFTASTSVYAETIVRELDPEKKCISYLLDRDFCLETRNGFFIKDLRVFRNRELKNMIIVDNLVHSFGFQIENGIPILEWRGNKSDRELLCLSDYLIKAKKQSDVRDYNRRHLKLLEFAEAKVESSIDI